MTETCPFEDPDYTLDIDTPCPVCGMRGFDWRDVQDKCVGMVPVTSGDRK